MDTFVKESFTRLDEALKRLEQKGTDLAKWRIREDVFSSKYKLINRSKNDNSQSKRNRRRA